MNRRDFMRSAAFTGLAIGLSKFASAQTGLAKSSKVLFGTEATLKEIADLEYRALLKREASILTAGHELKWDMLRPSPGRFDFANADSMLSFAESNGMKFHGHTLCWHEALPAWMRQSTTRPAPISKLLREHITTVASRYRGRIHCWDVVNEVIEPADKRPDGLRNSIFLQECGADYISEAFRSCRAADPNALLAWNENWLESQSEYSEAKRHATMAHLKRLKSEGVPIDILGMQAHLFSDFAVTRKFETFLDSVEDLGIALAITELDVRDRDLPFDTNLRDAAVAGIYENFLKTVGRRNVKFIQTWGLTDRFTWINTDARSRRPDGMPSRALPFDSRLQPKAAYRVIAQIRNTEVEGAR